MKEQPTIRPDGISPGQQPLPRSNSHYIAEQCRDMGLKVGDVIVGREPYASGGWSDAELTLLCLGEYRAFWSVRRRSSDNPEYVERDESASWNLNCRWWFKVESEENP